LAFLQSGYSIHTGVLLGQQRVRDYNYVDMLRSVLLLGVFALLAFRPSPTPLDYVHAAYGAYGIALLASALATRNSPPPSMPAPAGVWRTMASQGLMVQGANGLQLVLYRVSYWLIEHYRNTSLLGLYVVANQLSEGAWLVPRSVAVVLYSKVSNTESTEGQKRVIDRYAEALRFLRSACIGGPPARSGGRIPRGSSGRRCVGCGPLWRCWLPAF
jgi:O-antigen/teichoic acid export membrane protein